jgi:hypothetical protein
MASTSGPVELAGLFKTVFSKLGLVDAVPAWAVVQDRWKFEEAEPTGDKYVFAIAMQKEGGFTYAPTSGSNAGAQTMNSVISGAIVRAEVEGYGIYLRSRLSYDAAAKAAKAGKQAFGQAYGALLKNMKESHQFRLECSLLYGRSGLGKVNTNTSGALVLYEDTFADGIWAAGLKDSILEAWTGTGATATQHNGDLTISGVDIPTFQVTVTGTSAAVVQNDHLYFKGSRTATGYNECPGLYFIMTNTGSLFTIDAGVFDSWKTSSFAVGGQISLTAIMKAAAQGVAYGLEDAVLLINPVRFAQLASDEAALRRYNDDGAKAKRGPRSISFSMGNVEVEIVAHPLVKRGHAMLLPADQVHRIGSTDVTMSLPGSDEPLNVIVSGVTAIELHSMSDQGIFIEVPARAVLMTGITS